MLPGCSAGGDDDTADDDTADDDAVDDDSGDDDSEPVPVEMLLACDDIDDDVNVTPGGLPAWDPSVLGDIVRCSVGEALTVAELGQRLIAAGVADVTPIAGASTYRIAYRTTRWEGQEGVGTARLYLPDGMSAHGAMPIIVVTHGTAGLADQCAPSRTDWVNDYLALPFVGRGFAVVAPDYAGLGTEGIQGYGDNHDTAHSVLDAARALRGAVPAHSLAAGLIVAGHSQGGGSALSAHALSAGYGDDDVLGVIPFAPGWSIDTEGIWGASHYPALVPFLGTPAVVTTLALYADAANFVGPEHGADYFAAAVAASVEEAVESDCVVELLLSLPPLGTTFADVIDATFLDTLAACLDGAGDCGPPGEGYAQRAQQNLLSVDAGGGPILIMQGLEDVSADPATTACIVDKLVADGITPQVCTYEGLGHMDIVKNSVGFAVDWAEALAVGGTLPSCLASELPPCD